MDIILSKNITSVIKNAENYCSKQGIELQLLYTLSEELLIEISERSEELPSLYFVSVELLRTRLKNGCFLMKKKN